MSGWGCSTPPRSQIAWSNISGNLPDVPAWSIQVQQLSAGGPPVLYVGTDVGVFWTTNMGASWSSFGTGLPNVQARALSLNLNPSNPSQDELLVGTFGAGAYEITPDLTPARRRPVSSSQSISICWAGRPTRAVWPHWTAVLNTLGNTPAGRAQIVTDFEQSPEYLNDVVTTLYEPLPQPRPDPLAQGWVTALENGATIEQVIDGIVSSPEFFQKAGGTNGGYVNALYNSILGRAADPAGYATWVNALNTGTSRAAVAQGFLTSTEYRQDLVAGVGWTHTNGSWNDALLGVLAFASIGVRVSSDFDAVHCRSHVYPSQGCTGAPSCTTW